MEFLKNILSKYYSPDLVDKILSGLKSDRVSSFRVNTIKSTVDNIESVLQYSGISYDKVPFYADAFMVDNLEKIESLDIYKNGLIYEQSLSSMIPPLVLDAKEKDTVLDMCAAPGGKTTQIAALTSNKAHITACEMNNIRIEKLKYNVDLQGAKSVYVMNVDARTLDDYYSFDKILLDAPCSGSGTLDIKDSRFEKYFTIKLVEKSVKSQLALLRKAVKILKKGGTLVYSTCSILPEENCKVLDAVLGDGSVVLEPIDSALISSLPTLPSKYSETLTVCPTDKYEGFFVAKLKKVR